jgi:hypothetical protein
MQIFPVAGDRVTILLAGDETNGTLYDHGSVSLKLRARLSRVAPNQPLPVGPADIAHMIAIAPEYGIDILTARP